MPFKLPFEARNTTLKPPNGTLNDNDSSQHDSFDPGKCNSNSKLLRWTSNVETFQEILTLINTVHSILAQVVREKGVVSIFNCKKLEFGLAIFFFLVGFKRVWLRLKGHHGPQFMREISFFLEK